ncbi:MAG: response regulator transcription factor [Bacillota bacterium]
MFHNQIKVVIADDEGMIRTGIKRIVTSHGEEWDVVGTFKNGKELLECYQQNNLKFDLLITDVKMPVVDGLTLIKELKKSTDFESIVISGFDDFSYLQTAIREGAVDYILKPIDRDEFSLQLSRTKERIEQERWKRQKLKEVQQKASRFGYVRQASCFSQMIWQRESCQIDWKNASFIEGYYMLMHVAPDAAGNIASVLEQLLTESNLRYWLSEGEQQSYWILCYHEYDGGELKATLSQFANKLKVRIIETTSFTISIAISPVVQDLNDLSLIKQDVSELLQFRLVCGGNQIFDETTIQQLLQKKQVLSSPELVDGTINQIVTAIERLHVQEVEEGLELLFEKLRTFASPKEIEQVIHSLCIQIVYFTMKSIPLQDDESKREGLLLSKRPLTLVELKKELQEWVMEMIEQLTAVYNEQNTDHLQLAKRWIKEHLHESITIERIAKEMYMNPTYFCELFKSQTGETVLDYITKERMQKAKELLLRTDLRVYEIAQRVGYTDTKYFSKLFKRYFDELPSIYREKKLV